MNSQAAAGGQADRAGRLAPDQDVDVMLAQQQDQLDDLQRALQALAERVDQLESRPKTDPVP